MDTDKSSKPQHKSSKPQQSRDVYVVRPATRGAMGDALRFGATENARLPGGKTIHTVDRATFNKAVKAAMKDANAK